MQRVLDVAYVASRERTAHRVAAADAAVAMLARLGQPYEYDKNGFIRWDGEQWGLADLVHQAVKLPEHAPSDFLIPWIARELVKLAKAVIDSPRKPVDRAAYIEGLHPYQVVTRDYLHAVHALYDKAPAIAQWSKETRTDIGKVGLAQALEAIATYVFKESLVEQGAVVYTFADGWTVQELRTETALSQEGKRMQNCIGGYFEDVATGRVRIYSVRDASGQPHVSLELVIPGGTTRVHASDMTPDEFVESRTRLDCHFEQILGKQNDRPIDEYRVRAREFIDKVFDKEGLGWSIAGGPSSLGRFEGRNWSGVDFPEVLRVNYVGDILAGASFDGAKIDQCKFEDINGGAADARVDPSVISFAHAEISETSFQGANLRYVSFDGARGYFVDFRSAILAEASFDGAHMGGSDFRRTSLEGASFRGANVDGAKFDGAQGGRLANWEGASLTDVQRTQLSLPQAPDDYLGEAAARRARESRA